MKFIKIGDLDRPISFGWNATCEFEDLTGGAAYKAILDMDHRKLRALLYVGLRLGAKEEKKDFEYTIEDVGGWLDGIGLELIEEVSILFAKSLPQEKPGKTGAKKKTLN